jgi:hypothetical protein
VHERKAAFSLACTVCFFHVRPRAALWRGVGKRMVGHVAVAVAGGTSAVGGGSMRSRET